MALGGNVRHRRPTEREQETESKNRPENSPVHFSVEHVHFHEQRVLAEERFDEGREGAIDPDEVEIIDMSLKENQ